MWKFRVVARVFGVLAFSSKLLILDPFVAIPSNIGRGQEVSRVQSCLFRTEKWKKINVFNV
jgi:hypothetical protein